jgi:hypothetical protein
MRLYGVVLGVLFIFYLMGLFLGKNQFVEARPKDASLPIADTLLEDVEPELDFYQRLMGPSLTESDQPSSEDASSAVSEPLQESPTASEPSATLLFDVYTVQVGAFAAEVEARQILIRLEAKGYSSLLMPPSDSDPYYRVSVGEFATDQEALGMEEELSKDGFLTYTKRIQVSSATQ